ncbi:hypothetical protein OCU04_009098 [Sclerotinia nivalis]|uniref:FAD linked oxidase N-terminal domain-containing protein n=1 Tax=Sclerotinia nivalis TaxID=352851 RepID=A0A9X0AHZ9_9HELO|nr:hypothetical protein OCU04_009098 [Sclerotinia nivalis]
MLLCAQRSAYQCYRSTCHRETGNNSRCVLISVFHHNHQIPITVRCGGYPYFGSKFSSSALKIDLPCLASIRILSTGHSAVIGGIIEKDLARKLSRERLMASIAAMPSMVYAGWATYGGYNPFSAACGLGVDQMIVVKIVDSNGEITGFDVEEKDGLLRAVRGGGGASGFFVEMRVKVRGLQKILAGKIVFGLKGILKIVETLDSRFTELPEQGLPTQLIVQQLIFPSPREKVFRIHSCML